MTLIKTASVPNTYSFYSRLLSSIMSRITLVCIIKLQTGAFRPSANCNTPSAAVCPRLYAAGWKISHGCFCFLRAWQKRETNFTIWGSALLFIHCSWTGNRHNYTTAWAGEEEGRSAGARCSSMSQFRFLCQQQPVPSRWALTLHVTICTEQLAAASVPTLSSSRSSGQEVNV